jgi:conjugal transfer/entry exclusion protein
MQRLELASGHATASRLRRRAAPSTLDSVYAELLDQLLGPIQRRRREAQRILDGLAQRRAAMSSLDRTAASHSLRAQAVQIRNELARLSLIESLVRRILQPLASRDSASSPAPDPLARKLASRAPRPTGERERTDARQRASSGRASLAR